MKINLKNTCYPKPILSELTDDYVNNKFSIQIEEQIYDKAKQTLKLKINTILKNDFLNKLIEEEKVYIILHLEQKTQRESSVLKVNSVTEKTIDLYNYSTNESIEMLAILYCAVDFKITNKQMLNSIYGILDDEILYERGDIIGFSNGIDIKLPEDKRIGSIFNLIKDTENVLKDQPFSVSLDGELIQILMNNNIHNKFVSLYKKDQYIKRLMFFTIVEPAIITAYTEMFISYDNYKEKKWCRTLAGKVEKNLKQPADEIFIEENYDISKVYKFANYALGELYKDALDIYESGMED